MGFDVPSDIDVASGDEASLARDGRHGAAAAFVWRGSAYCYKRRPDKFIRGSSLYVLTRFTQAFPRDLQSSNWTRLDRYAHFVQKLLISDPVQYATSLSQQLAFGTKDGILLPRLETVVFFHAGCSALYGGVIPLILGSTVRRLEVSLRNPIDEARLLQAMSQSRISLRELTVNRLAVLVPW